MLKAVVFDADGVLQEPSESVIELLRRELALPTAETEAVLRRIYDAERPCMIGQADFLTELRRVLKEVEREASFDAALAAWRAIRVDAACLDVVSALRAAGLSCFLASNQHSYRASYMAKELGYERFFDRVFFSCDFGSVKPDRSYFERLLREMAVPPSDALFIDDGPRNVEAARSLGMNAHLFPVPCPEPRSDELKRILLAHGLRVEDGPTVTRTSEPAPSSRDR